MKFLLLKFSYLQAFILFRLDFLSQEIHISGGVSKPANSNKFDRFRQLRFELYEPQFSSYGGETYWNLSVRGTCMYFTLKMKHVMLLWKFNKEIEQKL